MLLEQMLLHILYPTNEPSHVTNTFFHEVLSYINQRKL